MRIRWVTQREVVLGSLSGFLIASPATAGGSVDQAWVKSLATSGKTVMVVEYYDPAGKAVDRKGYVSAKGFAAKSGVEIAVDAKTSLHLFGLEPCKGEMVNRREGFAGSCDDYALHQLAIYIKALKVIYCRAFLTERGAPNQDVTCFGYLHYPGAVDAVDNIEEQLVSVGALRLARKPHGSPMRPDLAEAERIGRLGYGMWVDPRVKKQ